MPIKLIPKSKSDKLPDLIQGMLDRVLDGTATPIEERMIRGALDGGSKKYTTPAGDDDLTKRLETLIGRKVTGLFIRIDEYGCFALCLRAGKRNSAGFILVGRQAADLSLTDPQGGFSMQQPVIDPKPRWKSKPAAQKASA